MRYIIKQFKLSEKEKDDIAIEKMLLSMQATKMKIDSRLGRLRQGPDQSRPPLRLPSRQVPSPRFFVMHRPINWHTYFIKILFIIYLFNLGVHLYLLPLQSLSSAGSPNWRSIRSLRRLRPTVRSRNSRRSETRNPRVPLQPYDSQTPSDAKKPTRFVIGTYRTGSTDELRGQENKKNESEEGVAPPSRERSDDGQVTPPPRQENEWMKSWSKIVALVDLADKEEEEEESANTITVDGQQQEQPKTVVAQPGDDGGDGGDGGGLKSSNGAGAKKEREGLRERGFKKGLEMGITRISKISKANFKGIYAGGKSLPRPPAIASPPPQTVLFCCRY